ncbi:GNAT family N-acetyltransferase [Pseudogulbenkiania ferrooxidans]|uniref:Putative amino-acid acetyltransferase n=1 Tax=Pseudogulbenkiania ferrooxidans 2002 TaxID=279714 RepID=B9Z8C7_9NEIS|nr:GNAT family protein [Pseudogulbenkiania ferrooxidans]EEG07030.1 putative amino-acid acetyltransferase [Pseudogulbenkiania ferrooxidans 2002]
MRFCEPITLNGRYARLEPLTLEHHDGLAAAVRDGELWRLWYTAIPTPDGMRAEIERRLTLSEQGSMLPFAVRRLDKGELCGMTTFMNVEQERRRVEIGSTWYAHSAQRTAINTECKLMLLAHAFDALGCIAVEFRTSWMNQASRAAIARLGAKQDGILRNHQLLGDGVYRDTVVFSIIDQEWPAVRQHLRFKLDSREA